MPMHLHPCAKWVNLFFIYKIRSPSTHNMSPIVRRLFLHFLPKLMMMRRTKYILPDYDDTAPSHGYINEIDVRWVMKTEISMDFPNNFLIYWNIFSHVPRYHVIAHRDSISDFTSDYKIDGQDGNFENNIGASMPHSSGKNSISFNIFLIYHLNLLMFSQLFFTELDSFLSNFTNLRFSYVLIDTQNYSQKLPARQLSLTLLLVLLPIFLVLPILLLLRLLLHIASKLNDFIFLHAK